MNVGTSDMVKFWPLSSCYFPYSFAKYFVNICENKDDISAIIMRQWLLFNIIIWSFHVTPALERHHVVFTTLKLFQNHYYDSFTCNREIDKPAVDRACPVGLVYK